MVPVEQLWFHIMALLPAQQTKNRLCIVCFVCFGSSRKLQYTTEATCHNSLKCHSHIDLKNPHGLDLLGEGTCQKGI